MSPNDANPVTAVLAKLALLFGTPGDEDSSHVSFPALAPPMTTRDLDFLEGQSELPEAERYAEALEFATLVNEIPRVGVRWRGTGRLLWNVYDRLRDEAEWPPLDRSEEEKARIENARETIDELRDAYEEHRVAYRDVERSLRERRLTAEHAEDPDKVAEAEAEIERLETEKEDALRAWKDAGKKNAYEEAIEEIHRLTESSPWAMRSEWDDELKRAKHTEIGANQRFYWTDYWPRDFLDSDRRWQTVTLDGSEVKSLSQTADEEFPGLWDADLVANELQAMLSIERLAFDVATIRIRRPWFDVTKLTSGTWRLPEGREPVSDGGDGDDPPEGRIPAYVTEIVFVKNLVIELEADEETQETVQQLREGALRNFGPIPLEQPPSTLEPEDVRTLGSATFDPEETAALHTLDRKLTSASVDAAGVEAPAESARARKAEASPIANEPRLRTFAEVVAGNNVGSGGDPDESDDPERPDTVEMMTSIDPVPIERPERDTSDEESQARRRDRRKRRRTSDDDGPRVRDHRTRRRRSDDDDGDGPRVRDHRTRRRRSDDDDGDGPRVRDHRTRRRRSDDDDGDGPRVRDHRTRRRRSDDDDGDGPRVRDHRTRRRRSDDDDGDGPRVRDHRKRRRRSDEKRGRPARRPGQRGQRRRDDDGRERTVVPARRGGIRVEGHIASAHPVDSDDESVRDARLTFRSDDVEKTVKTDENGRYRVQLRPGEYDVTVRAHAYQQQTDEIEVEGESGTSMTADFALQPTEITVEEWESMQPIGFVCRTVPKSPDPNETLWEVS